MAGTLRLWLLHATLSDAAGCPGPEQLAAQIYAALGAQGLGPTLRRWRPALLQNFLTPEAEPDGTQTPKNPN